jgi:zinc D-Ala-D-Ala carboxypeptidase
MTHLTPHFTLEELTFSETAERNGWDNSPNDKELENLKRLADFLEQVKTVMGGKPIMISSGLRTKKVNDAVGSKDTSQHRLGCAADFKVPGVTPDEVCRKIIASGIGYDQIIREYDRWIHISVPSTVDTAPRKQALIIDNKGTRLFA